MSLRIIRLKEVIALTGLSKSSIYRYADGKAFPQSIQHFARLIERIEEEINQWMQGRIDERRVE